MNIRPVGNELFHADGQTDRTKLTATFRNVANALKNTWFLPCCHLDNRRAEWSASRPVHFTYRPTFRHLSGSQGWRSPYGSHYTDWANHITPDISVKPTEISNRWFNSSRYYTLQPLKNTFNHDFTDHANTIFLHNIWRPIPNEAPIPLTCDYCCHLVNPFLTTKTLTAILR
jgi:hypothetical protein